MMNILFTHYSTAFGGAEKSTFELSAELAKNYNHRVFILLGTNSLNVFRNTQSDNVYYIKLLLPFWMYKFISPLIIIFLKYRFSINHVFLNIRNVKYESYVCKYLKAKSTLILRAILIDRKNSSELNYLENIICISDAVRNKVVELGYKGNLVRIYNGIKNEE